jgi:long-chain acyl-CoA synthetase
MSDRARPWLDHYDIGVPFHIDYPAVPLHFFLDEQIRKYPDQVCTIFRDQTISYSQIGQLSDALAAYFTSIGVQKGERIAIWLPNCPQFVVTFYAVLKAGAVVVALNPQYKQRELAFHLHDSGARLLVCLESSIETVFRVQPETRVDTILVTSLEEAGGLIHFSPRDSTSDSSGQNVFRLLSVIEMNLGKPRSDVVVGPEDEAIFQYSGGTTGVPKGAIGLHRNLVANTLQFLSWLVGLSESKEIVLTAIPLFHVYGMVIAMSMGIALGASLVLIPDPSNITDVLRNIDRYQATLFPGVPNLYNAINHHPDVLAGKYRLRSVKACISGSAPLLRDIKDRFEQISGGKLLEGYGLSEAPTATHCNPMLGENRPGSIGLPLPDVACRIVDLETGMIDLPSGERGELIVKGPQVMAGYHHMPEETTIALREGWLFTGDVAWMDADGYFYLVDRKKEVVKIGGFQVWPREVEEVISAHPGVLEVGVAGVPHPERVEIVKAWVVPRPGVN